MDGAAEAGSGDRAEVQIPIKIYRGRIQRDARRSKVQPRQAADGTNRYSVPQAKVPTYNAYLPERRNYAIRNTNQTCCPGGFNFIVGSILFFLDGVLLGNDPFETIED